MTAREAKAGDQVSPGAEAIARERHRQLDTEGWNAEHDDLHDDGQLAIRAAELAVAHTRARITAFSNEDDWGLLAKHTDAIRRLEIAGALIAAEIDRLQRVADRERLRRVYAAVLAELESGDPRRRQRALLWLASAEPCVEIMLWPREQDGGAA